MRFFKRPNTWYEKIPTNPSITPNSANYVADVLLKTSTLGVSKSIWSPVIWYADANTPRFDLEVTSSYAVVKQTVYDNDWNINVSVPPDLQPPPSQDGFTCVVNTATDEVWDLRHPVISAPGVISTVNQIGKRDLNDDGVDQPSTWNTTIVSGNPYLHGLIMYDEIQAGVIDHALAFGYNSAKSGSVGIYPLKGAQGGGNNINTYALLHGMRLQLDPSININNLGLNAAGVVIARAMQEYGIIFVVNTGFDNSLYAEDLDFHPTRSWTNIITNVNGIPLNQLRVIDPIYPADISVPDYQNISLAAAVKPTVKSDVNGLVTLATTTKGTTIRYTTNGSIPTAASTLYTGPFIVTNGTVVKAITIKPSCSAGPYVNPFCWNDSGIAVAQIAVPVQTGWTKDVACSSIDMI